MILAPFELADPGNCPIMTRNTRREVVMDLIHAQRWTGAAGLRSRLRPTLATLIVMVVVVVALVGLVGTASPALAADRGTVFQVGGDVSIPRTDTADAVIAIGGDVTIAGTVRTAVAAVGGDVRLERTAEVGTTAQPDDTAIVLVGGTLTQAPGATVVGDVSTVTGSWAGDLWNRGIVDQVTRPFGGFSLIAWLGGTLLALAIAVFGAAVAPRQVAAVRDRVGQRLWSSLGWGALSLIVIVPLVTALLIVTVIGLLAVPPWLAVVVGVLLFGGVAVAALLGGLILARVGHTRENLILAAVIGVLILRLVAFIPFVGGVIVAVAWTAGFGATVVALWSWQRHRHELSRAERQVPLDRAA
jgi:hypothetical protein